MGDSVCHRYPSSQPLSRGEREGKPARVPDLPAAVRRETDGTGTATGRALRPEVLEVRLDRPLDESVGNILQAALALEDGNRSVRAPRAASASVCARCSASSRAADPATSRFVMQLHPMTMSLWRNSSALARARPRARRRRIDSRAESARHPPRIRPSTASTSSTRSRRAAGDERREHDERDERPHGERATHATLILQEIRRTCAERAEPCLDDDSGPKRRAPSLEWGPGGKSDGL
jgi:hypothetical protein